MPGTRGGRRRTRVDPYQAWTVALLKEELTRRGLTTHTWDKKSTLLVRLRESDAAGRGAAGDASQPPQTARPRGAALARASSSRGRDTHDAGPTSQPAAEATPTTAPAASGDQLTAICQELAALRQEVSELRRQPPSQGSGPARQPTAAASQAATTCSSSAQPCPGQAPGEFPDAQSVLPDRGSGAPPTVRDIPGSLSGRDAVGHTRDYHTDARDSTPDARRDEGPDFTAANPGTLGVGLPPWPATARTFPLTPLAASAVQPGQTSAPLPVPGGPVAALHTQGTASGDLPRVELISSQLRTDIIQGKDVNLASLLIQGFTSESELGQRFLVTGSGAVPLKPLTDHRLKKPLTIQEFMKAFTTYRSVMCEVYPNRYKELDDYMLLILGLSQTFGGFVFYDYHREFSAQAATLLHDYGIKVDWARQDPELFSKVTAGRRANACTLCGTLAHYTRFCPLAADPATGRSKGTLGQGREAPRARGISNNREICLNYNSDRGCQRPVCQYVHACLSCRNPGHSRSQCRRADTERVEAEATRTVPSVDRQTARAAASAAKAKAAPSAPKSGN
jgi:hypothetical protein